MASDHTGCAGFGDAGILGMAGCMYGAGLGTQAALDCGAMASSGYLDGGVATARTGRCGKRPYWLRWFWKCGFPIIAIAE